MSDEAKKAVQAIAEKGRRFVRVNAREHIPVSRALAMRGINVVSAPIRVGGLLVARELTRV